MVMLCNDKVCNDIHGTLVKLVVRPDCGEHTTAGICEVL